MQLRPLLADCSHCNKLQENDIFHFNRVRNLIPNSHQLGLEFPGICDKLRDACVPKEALGKVYKRTLLGNFIPYFNHVLYNKQPTINVCVVKILSQFRGVNYI